jgi:hypothetical protein
MTRAPLAALHARFLESVMQRHKVKPFVVRRTIEQLPCGGHGSPNGSSAVTMCATSIMAATPVAAPQLC